MNKSIIFLCMLLAVAACTTFTSCENDYFLPAHYELLNGVALRNEHYVIEVDSTQPADMRQFVIPPISKDSLFRYLLTGGWAETEAYGLYLDGSMTENLLNHRYDFHVIFDNNNDALLCLRFLRNQEIKYAYDEDNNYLTLSNLCLPSQYFEEVRKQKEGCSEDINRVISISDEEMLLISPYGLYDERYAPPAPYCLRVFTHASYDEAIDWKRRR